MKVIIFNPSHNGDVLFSSGIVGHIVKSNPTIEFTLVPACSSILYKQYESANVKVKYYVTQWNINHSEYNESRGNREIEYMHDTLWQQMDDTIYINIYKLMKTNLKAHQPFCHTATFANIYNKQDDVLELFRIIYNTTGFKLEFNVTDYKELIPVIPKVDVSFVQEAIDKKGKKDIVMFYNLVGCSGQESAFSSNFNDLVIEKLLEEYKDSLIILVASSSIKADNILNLEDDLNIKKEVDGGSIVLYGNICELCDHVYFKDNGGSLFQLNQSAINNPRTKYYFLDRNTELFGRRFTIYKEVYRLNCELVHDVSVICNKNNGNVNNQLDDIKTI